MTPVIEGRRAIILSAHHSITHAGRFAWLPCGGGWREREPKQTVPSEFFEYLDGAVGLATNYDGSRELFDVRTYETASEALADLNRAALEWARSDQAKRTYEESQRRKKDLAFGPLYQNEWRPSEATYDSERANRDRRRPAEEMTFDEVVARRFDELRGGR